ncbi:MAG: hypothetical protein AAGG07_11045 [Planctomycetota bacterium]
MQNVKTTVAALTVAAVSQGASAAVTQFADATFDSGWSFESHTTPLGGSEGGAVLIDRSWRQATADYLRFRYYTPVESVIHGMAFWDETSWDPSTDGVIGAVDVGMLSLNLNQPGSQTVARVLIKQGDRYFVETLGVEAGNENAYYEQTIQAEDFIELDVVNDDYIFNSHPDFSGSEELVFGLGMTWAFHQGVIGENWTYGMDNFFLRIHHRPVPAPGALAVLGLAAALRRRR